MSLVNLFKYSAVIILLFIFETCHCQENESSSDISLLINNGELKKAESLLLTKLSTPNLSDSEKYISQAFLADILFYREEYNMAIQNYSLSLTIAARNHQYTEIAEQYKNIAICYSQLFQYGEALKWHQQALDIFKQYSIEPNQTVLSILLSQSSIYGYIGANEQSLETISKAQKLAVKLKNMSALSDSYVRIAATNADRGEYQSAIEYLKLVDIKEMNDMSSLAWYYSLYSESLLNTGYTEKARTLIHDAINSSIIWTDEILHTFEIILLESYIQDKNMQQVDQSLNNFMKDQDRFRNSWLLNHMLAQKYMLQQNYEKSYDQIITAISIFFKTINKEGQSKRNLYFEIPEKLIEDGIESAMLLGKNQSVVMYKLFYLAFLAKQPIQVKKNTEQSVAGSDYNSDSAVVNDILSAEESINFNDIVRFSEFQSHIKQQEGYVFYLQIRQSYYALLIDNQQIITVKLEDKADKINNLVIQILSQIENNNPQWIDTSFQLHQALIHPLRTKGLQSLKYIHFIQDETLRFLPMDVLIDEQAKLLGDRHIISIMTVKALNKYILNKNNNTTHSSHLDLLGSGNGKIDVKNYWQTAYRNLNSTKNLAHADKELKYLKRNYQYTSLALDKEATEQKARETIATADGILHFASHGFDNPLAPAYSALILQPDKIHDGLLQAREISGLSTHANLVILSSCSSAKGGLSGLYGYNSGLAESFIIAGAKSVIGTLWDINDEKAYQFMQWFYQGLVKKMTVGEALAFAKKVAQISKWKPHDWSGFILLGQSDNMVLLIKNDKRWGLTTVLILAFLVLLIAFIIKFHISRINRYIHRLNRM